MYMNGIKGSSCLKENQERLEFLYSIIYYRCVYVDRPDSWVLTILSNFLGMNICNFGGYCYLASIQPVYAYE